MVYITTTYIARNYTRKVRGKEQTVSGKIKTYMLACDSCGSQFTRTSKEMKPHRACNEYKHVCTECDSKKFAQKLSSTSRRINRYDASSNVSLDYLISNSGRIR